MLKILFLYLNKVYPTYKILTGHTTKKKYVYKLFILLISLFMIFYISVPLFTDFIYFDADSERKTNQCVNVFFLLVFDLFLILFRYKKNVIVKKSQLIIYPFSKEFVNLVPFLTIMFDEKILIYIAFSIPYIIKSMFNNYYHSVIIVFLLGFLLFFSINILSSLFLFHFDKLVAKTNIIGLLFLTTILIFNVLNISNKMYLLCTIPIIGNSGNILFALSNSHNSDVILYNFIPIFILSFISFLFLLIEIKK